MSAKLKLRKGWKYQIVWTSNRTGRTEFTWRWWSQVRFFVERQMPFGSDFRVRRHPSDPLVPYGDVRDERRV